MMLEIVPYEEATHYPIVEKWWKAHKWTPMPAKLLPKTGKLVYLGNEPLAACWLVLMNCPIAMLEWMVSTPKTKNKAARRDAISLLLRDLTKEAFKRGAYMVSTLTFHPSLLKRFDQLEFMKGNKPLIHRFKLHPEFRDPIGGT